METHFPSVSGGHRGLARERVLADLRALATDGEALLRATADDAGTKVKEARARLSSAIDQAKSSYDELQSRGLRSVRDAAHRADETVREHPYQTVGVAFGIGVILGALLRRR